MSSDKPRASFTSRFGVIAAAAGSAIGLGNIWKFPYITGEYGGAAFLFVYLGFIALVGLPVMLSEFIIGRSTRKNAFGAFQSLAPKSAWPIVGFMGVLAAFFIISFYGVIAGWSIKYVIFAGSNSFAGQSPEYVTNLFTGFTESAGPPVRYQLLFMVFTGLIVVAGVQKGIERSAKVLMPLLLVLIIILDIRAVTLPGSREGLKFLFNPDFSKLSSEGVLKALGHAFFSLSLGMGTLITYGSYIRKKNNLANTAVSVTIADTFIAILAGIAIFPAVFAFNIEPSAGPGLVFITLPNVFAQMPGGYAFSILFFILLTVAALTSSISILEVVVAYFTEELNMTRKVGTIIASIMAALVGVICSLSFGILKDYTFVCFNFFDLLDFIASDVLLPLGGALIAAFVGWKLGKTKVVQEISQGGSMKEWMVNVFIFLVRFIAPAAILYVFVMGLIEKLGGCI
jgi:NSS family neurotransmitter:Na+ symporter